MILPTTDVSALLLLLLSFVCLGSWANTFKLTGTRWRFELFYIDFAIGALLLCVIAAFTLGTLGPDLAFSDRMLVAGRTAQAFVVGAGFVFNLGNMLLLAAVSLLGVASAFPLSVGVALVVTSLFHFHRGNFILLIIGIVLMIVAVVLDARACRLRDRSASKTHRVAVKATVTAPPTVAPKPSGVRLAPKAAPGKTRARKTNKGLLLAVLGGIALGLFYPAAANGTSGEFGLGPYAGMLMLSIGILISTFIYNFYFLNIAIDGPPTSFGAYFKGNVRQHLLGFGGGALWAIGALCAALASVPAQTAPHRAAGIILPVGSVLLMMLWGMLAWKEFATAGRQAKLALSLAALLFACSVILFGIGIAA